MSRFTIAEFRKAYPNDDACLDKLFQLRYSDMKHCPECQKATKWHRSKCVSAVRKAQRKCYECQNCGYQVYPTAGTVFEKTTTPLTSWFYAIYLFTATRNGVAAKELERQLGVTYKTAWRMAHQIRLLMANNPQNIMTGTVEMDETFVGGLQSNKSKSERLKASQVKKKLTGGAEKIPVFGIIERGGRIFTKVLDSDKVSADILVPIIKEKVSKDSIVISDGHAAYKHLNKSFIQHEAINHQSNEYARGPYHTNTIEGYWSQLKRTIKGTHIFVSRKHLKKYVDEVTFRYENRNEPNKMFDTILSQVD